MSDGAQPRVELRVREPTPAGAERRQRAVYDRLERLQRNRKVADVAIEVWGKQVRARTPSTPTDDPIVGPARAAYETFESWAKRNGHDLEPAFSVHSLGSLVDDERETVIRFPVMCLAVYNGDDLRSVAPCTTDEGVHTIEDCLTALQSGTVTPASVETVE